MQPVIEISEDQTNNANHEEGRAATKGNSFRLFATSQTSDQTQEDNMRQERTSQIGEYLTKKFQ